MGSKSRLRNSGSTSAGGVDNALLRQLRASAQLAMTEANVMARTLQDNMLLIAAIIRSVGTDIVITKEMLEETAAGKYVINLDVDDDGARTLSVEQQVGAETETLAEDQFQEV